MKTKNPEPMQLLLFPCLIILLTLLSSCAQTKVSGSGVTGIKEMDPQKTQVVDQSKDLSGIGDLFFDFKTSVLPLNTVEQLKSIAKWMLANPSANLVIEGYGDENESSEDNLALAECRAESAKDSLIYLGIASSRLKTVNRGEEKPFSIGRTEDSVAQKRMMLVEGMGGGGSMPPKHVLVNFFVEGRGRSMPPKHVFSWQDLCSLNGEKSGYATYSYVLTGRSATNSDASVRYLKLIDAVKGQSTPDSLISAKLRSSYNLFLIPSKKDQNTANCKPDYEVSKQLLDAISIKLSKALLNQGPYIITLYKPVGEGNPDAIADLLYVDLTRVRPAAFPEFVRVYKNHVSREQIHGIEKLDSLRAELLNLMLITEECIGFAKVAYAELQRSFSQAGQGKSSTQQSHEVP
jgi:peptidoglycan-associated lipoprotein